MDSLFKQLLRYHSPFVAYHPLICRRWLSKSAGTSGKSLPTIKMSDLEKCFGCGAQFQDQNAERPGFLPDMQRRKEASLLGLPFEQYLRSVSNEVAVNPLANHNERKQQQLICARCHHLTFHRSLPAVEKSPNGDIRSDANETAERVLTALKQSPEGQVVAVCDILDFPGSLCLNILRQLPPQQPLTIAVNKADLLPEQSNFDRIHHYLKRLLKRELNGCVDLHLISAKSGQGVDKMVEQLFRRRYQLNRGGENIYLIGNTNVGKSSLLNRWLSAYQGRWGWRATESTVPGTTLDLISHQLNQLPGLRNAVVAGKSRIQVPASLDAVDSTFLPAKTSLFEPQRHSALTSSVISRLLGGRLVDTPGLENGENLADWLLAESHEELSLVQPTKPLRPESFLLRPGRSLWLGGMARLDYMESSNTIGADNDSSVQVIATVYRSPKVPLHLSSVEKATDLLQTQLGGQGKYWPESIIIPVKPTDKRAVRRKNPSKDLWSGVIMVPPVFSHPRQLLGRLSDHQIDINSERRDKVKQLSLLTERISRFPPFQLAKEFSIPCGDGVKVDSDIDGDYVKQMRQLSPHSPRHFSRSLVDVVIAGVGWLSLTGNFFSKDDGDRQARFQLYTPGGRGVSIRSPSMLPFDVMRRGHRVRTTDRYKQPSDSTINSAASADRQWWITNRSHVDR
jgi:ribosome biogenesis GTPase A